MHSATLSSSSTPPPQEEWDSSKGSRANQRSTNPTPNGKWFLEAARERTEAAPHLPRRFSLDAVSPTVVLFAIP